MPQVLAEEFKTIPMSPNLGQSLERAHAAAREQSHRFVLLEHLLFALTEDPEASLILQSANVDPAGLGADVSRYLGGLGDELRAPDAGEARPDTELLRVLQAAASAAQQSKRRQIDGAIVLAAIVGDGKSPAAGLLKTHGMTFEEAIRALQRANTKARLKPHAKPALPAGQAQAAPSPPAAPQPLPVPAAAPVTTRNVEVEPAPEPPAPQPEPSPEESLTLDTPPEPPTPSVATVLDDIAEPPASAPPRPASPGVQSADEILAAARARIQKRTAVLSQAPDAPYFSTPPVQEPASPERPRTAAATPSQPASLHAQTDAVSDAMRELLVSSGAEARPASPAESLRESLTGAAATIARDTVVPLRPEPPAPLAPPPPTPGPFMQAAMAEAARSAPPGADRAGPMPPWPGTPGPPGHATTPAHAPQSFQSPPAPFQTAPPPPFQAPPSPMQAAPPSPMQAAPPPWPGASAGPAPAPGGPAPAGAPMDRRRLKRAAAPLPPMQAPPPARKANSASGERGPLVEAIPRRMRLGFSTEGEVRIAQERIDHLVQALSGRATNLGYGDPIVMRALTVRLKAQDGDFFIEPITPETQWVEAQPHGVHVEPLTWRWSITPREGGKGRLVLQVSMRSIDLDGESEEVGPPDRMVEIKVRSPWVKRMIRRVLFVIALAVAFAAGKFGATLGPLLLGAIRSATGL